MWFVKMCCALRKTFLFPNDYDLFFFHQEDGKALGNKHGEFWFEFSNGSLFCVTKYEGFEDKHYICLHSSSLNLYHQGKKQK